MGAAKSIDAGFVTRVLADVLTGILAGGARGCAAALVLIVGIGAMGGLAPVAAQTPALAPIPAAPPGAQIVYPAGEPELWVDGVPFFIHAAQFDYFRIPRGLWSRSLNRYVELGINTIDLRIPWNWHETREAEFDFQGRTNPRRDLRSLLALIVERRFRLIVRPGPLVGEHWKDQGIPAWVMGSPGPDGSEADAGATQQPGVLAEPEHMAQVRRWLEAVARELAPYSSSSLVRITETNQRGKSVENDVSGPLLLVALGNADGVTGGGDPEQLWRYLGELRQTLAENLDAIYFVPEAGPGALGPARLAGASGPENDRALAVAGQWSFAPSPGDASPGREGPLLGPADAASVAWLASSLATQPSFPPLLSDFATTTFAPAGDIRAAQPSPANLLLASRLFIAGGIGGIEYAPLQDTLTPAGWNTGLAARHFRWDAPLDLAGNRGVRAEGVARNGELLSAWGAMLAASHLRADFGVVDLRAGVFAGGMARSQAAGVGTQLQQILRAAAVEGFTAELLNPDRQPVERLLRSGIILLPVPEAGPQGGAARVPLSETAQRALVEFVRRGGTLIHFPARPQGALLEPLWPGPGTPSGEFTSWPVGNGRVISSTNNFELAVQEPLPDRAASRSGASGMFLSALLARAGLVRKLRRAEGGSSGNVIVSELVPNAPGPRGCAPLQLCAAALISVTNLSADQPATETLELVDPRPAVSSGPAVGSIALEVEIPARESILLPIGARLCSAAAPEKPCTDEVVSAGAELLAVQRDGQTLGLMFYAPSRATVRLRLESPPSKVVLDQNIRLEPKWNNQRGELEVEILRGPAPHYLRLLQVQLPYTPHVVEKEEAAAAARQFLEVSVFDALRLPLAPDASLPSDPPLIPVTEDRGSFLISSWNQTAGARIIQFELDGAYRGSNSARSFPGQQHLTRLRFQAVRGAGNDSPRRAPAEYDMTSLPRGELEIRSGRDTASNEVRFLPVRKDAPLRYRYDLDRDGETEWVMENEGLRLIVSPADGGRLLALAEKSTGQSLITFGGALHERFVEPGGTPAEPVAYPGNSAGASEHPVEWVERDDAASLRLLSSTRGDRAEQVEKTVTLGEDTVEVGYRIFSGEAPEARPLLVTAATVAIAVTRAGRGDTSFCWQQDPAPSEPRCEDVSPAGSPVRLPPQVRRMEIHHTGRNTLAVEWDSGEATIVPRLFSAELQILLPAARAEDGNRPGEHTLRYTVVYGDGR